MQLIMLETYNKISINYQISNFFLIFNVLEFFLNCCYLLVVSRQHISRLVKLNKELTILNYLEVMLHIL